ncbi:MAG: NAD(P)H-dependent oxidoreductase subunit E, partial [Bacteroidota bacterium]
MSKNLGELSGRKGLRENLFEELGVAATNTGTVSKEKVEELAGEFLFGTANVYGTVTFYDFLRPENQGKKAYVCNGSSCMTAGTQGAVKEKLKGSYKEEEIGEMCCLGRCHENSSFNIDGKNYSGTDINDLAAIKTGKFRSAGAHHVAH